MGGADVGACRQLRGIHSWKLVLHAVGLPQGRQGGGDSCGREECLGLGTYHPLAAGFSGKESSSTAHKLWVRRAGLETRPWPLGYMPSRTYCVTGQGPGGGGASLALARVVYN